MVQAELTLYGYDLINLQTFLQGLSSCSTYLLPALEAGVRSKGNDACVYLDVNHYSG